MPGSLPVPGQGQTVALLIAAAGAALLLLALTLEGRSRPGGARTRRRPVLVGALLLTAGLALLLVRRLDPAALSRVLAGVAAALSAAAPTGRGSRRPAPHGCPGCLSSPRVDVAPHARSPRALSQELS